MFAARPYSMTWTPPIQTPLLCFRTIQQKTIHTSHQTYIQQKTYSSKKKKKNSRSSGSTWAFNRTLGISGAAHIELTCRSLPNLLSRWKAVLPSQPLRVETRWSLSALLLASRPHHVTRTWSLYLCKDSRPLLCLHTAFPFSPRLSACFWLCWVFVAACGLSLVAVHRLRLQRLLLELSTDSRLMGFSRCSRQAQ